MYWLQSRILIKILGMQPFFDYPDCSVARTGSSINEKQKIIVEEKNENNHFIFRILLHNLLVIR